MEFQLKWWNLAGDLRRCSLSTVTYRWLQPPKPDGRVIRKGILNKMLSYRRQTALQLPPKVEDWNWNTIFYGHRRSIFNHCDIIGLKIRRIRWKERKIRAITAFKVIKVIEIGTKRKPVCDFLLVINSNWHPTSYTVSELSQLIVLWISDTFRFRATLWGLRDNVRCSSWAHWKARSKLPISIN